jgi:DNA-binding transcriptional ArsR family regulator
VSDLNRTLAALADPKRRAAIDLLKQSPRRASELAALLSLSPPAMSRHLRVLRQANLVREESPPEDARVRVYELNCEPFGQLSDWVSDVESFWGDQLGAFKRHVEKRAERRPK